MPATSTKTKTETSRTASEMHVFAEEIAKEHHHTAILLNDAREALFQETVTTADTLLASVDEALDDFAQTLTAVYSSAS